MRADGTPLAPVGPGGACHPPTATILCFGDSNTYGYDPRSPLGGRYPPQVRWTGRLAAHPGWRIQEAGGNGREIPRSPQQLEGLARQCAGADLVIIMLGTNDLLQSPGLRAEDAAGRMECCIRFLLALPAAPRVLLVAPPPMAPGSWVRDPRPLRESARLGCCYRDLARRLEVSFADAGAWQVALLFDGVHFSPDGHQAFARGLLPVLEELTCTFPSTPHP